MTRKSATKPKAAPAKRQRTPRAPKVDKLDGHDPIDVAALALIKGTAPESVAEALRTKGIHRATAEAVVRKALERITIAADVKLAHELGLAITQLRDIYRTAMQLADVSAAMSARKELNKLLALYDVNPADLGDAEAQESAIALQLHEIEAHLRPLRLAPDDYPVAELARIAADKIRRAAK